jgi:glucan phosphoethanolaminetransferase (alkaline phosphatase superfamily)
MQELKEYIAALLFPVIYVLTDIVFRHKYLIYYSGIQLLFYIISVLFSISLFIFTIILIIKNRNRGIIKYSAASIAAFYYSSTIISSYVFISLTGIFPNYYTFAFIKNEPGNSLSLLQDSIHPVQVIFFSILFISLIFYFMFLSESELFRRISVKVKPSLLILILVPLLILQISCIHRCDQCLIVDANFTAVAGRHLAEWDTSRSFTGEGVPFRNPVKLNNIQREPGFNVLLIIFESLRRQNMQIYGYKRETTPFLNSLKNSKPENLHVFRNAYTVSTTTMLAVPAILTGITPEQPAHLFKSSPLVWEYAKILNYNTFFISSHSMQWYRFDKFFSAGKPDFYWNRDTDSLPAFNDLGIDDRITTDKLYLHLSGMKHKRFFGELQFNATHFPYKVPEEHAKWNEKYIDKYDNSVLYQDFLIEKVFSVLEKNHLIKNTVVIMVSDHGEAFREHNSIGHIDTFNTETISVPLIMYIPPGISSAINTSRIDINTRLNASTADIVPTIINILGLRKNRQVASIYSYLNGKNLLEPVDSERGIITLNSNDIINFNSGLSLIKSSRHYILRTNIVPYIREYYDMKSDPGETDNLVKKADIGEIEFMNSILSQNIYCKKILDCFYPGKYNRP